MDALGRSLAEMARTLPVMLPAMNVDGRAELLGGPDARTQDGKREQDTYGHSDSRRETAAFHCSYAAWRNNLAQGKVVH